MDKQKLLGEIENAKYFLDRASEQDEGTNTPKAIEWLADVLESLVLEVDELTRSNEKLEAKNKANETRERLLDDAFSLDDD